MHVDELGNCNLKEKKLNAVELQYAQKANTTWETGEPERGCQSLSSSGGKDVSVGRNVHRTIKSTTGVTARKEKRDRVTRLKLLDITAGTGCGLHRMK